MFFWGSYNFQQTQQTEHDERPPLRYPMYVPPSPSTFVDKDRLIQQSLATRAAAGNEGGVLERVLNERLRVRFGACGLKHCVLVLEDNIPHAFSSHDEGNESSVCQTGSLQCPPQVLPSMRRRIGVYGLGSNHSGQLGKHVATYCTTLTNLHLEDVSESPIISVACGARHTLVCTVAGCVYVTGENSCGQLGLPYSISTSKSQTFSNGAPCVMTFTQLTSLAHIKQVFASHNASFALDVHGKLYSWGDSQYGHLGHNDRGERLDTRTLKIVTEHAQPQLVRWFEKHRVSLVEVAVGRAHLVCRSEDDVYTCGEGFFGKLGHGNVLQKLQPTRVEFPQRREPEKLISIAAGDDHTLVLKDNPALGSVVYFFGKLNNGDGQLYPIIVLFPSGPPLVCVLSSRGNQCLALSIEGTLFVWGKHSYAKVHNGTDASALRSQPTLVNALLPYTLTGVVAGGTFIVAFASDLRDSTATSKQMPNKEPIENVGSTVGFVKASGHKWDVVVPHDARVGANKQGDEVETYEESVCCFLRQYLGSTLGMAYAADLPQAPARTKPFKYPFNHIGSHGLTVGQKVRLWMTDVYAIGTVIKLETELKVDDNDNKPLSNTEGACESIAMGNNQRGMETMESMEEGMEKTQPPHENNKEQGCRVCIEWQRDDWENEVLTLYTNDETLDEENSNRWQPFWFEQDEKGDYIITKGS